MHMIHGAVRRRNVALERATHSRENTVNFHISRYSRNLPAPFSVVAEIFFLVPSYSCRIFFFAKRCAHKSQKICSPLTTIQRWLRWRRQRLVQLLLRMLGTVGAQNFRKQLIGLKQKSWNVRVRIQTALYVHPLLLYNKKEMVWWWNEWEPI